ncbi:MAG: lytic transglycosylase domain-containing protein, partial [Rubrivivax sp.]|nr:lytic transglycosylase domain-containing protein [Rubrivivax sp.]
DRLRNDWLLELGKRRDWPNFSRDMPKFRMNDDREVTCYALLTRHAAGEDVRDAARSAWYGQRELDDGCNLMASALVAARQFGAAEVWQKAQLATEANRPRAAQAAVAMLDSRAAQAVSALFDNPARALSRSTGTPTGSQAELALLALMRLAANDPDAAAGQLDAGWTKRLSPAHAALAWAATGKQAALKLLPQAADHYQRAWQQLQRPGGEPAWSDDTLAWQVRAALRSPSAGAERWALVQLAVDAMSAAEQRDPAWVYWKARALQARAKPGADGDVDRQVARQAFESIAPQLNFYGKLATEELGTKLVMPAAPQPLTDAERQAARAQPGLARALQLLALGLRSEGVREWNYSLRGLADRELLAAA